MPTNFNQMKILHAYNTSIKLSKSKQLKTDFAEESDFSSLEEHEVENTFNEININRAIPRIDNTITRNGASI